jgi:hypothetical protein
MSVSIYGSGNTVIQVQSTNLVTAFTTTTNSFIDITGLTVSITPQSTTSKILVIASVAASADSDIVLRLARGGSAIGTGSVGSTANGFFQFNGTSPLLYSMLNASANYLDSPSSTSSLTYSVQAYVNSGHTGYINRRQNDTVYGGSSTITVMEIAYA